MFGRIPPATTTTAAVGCFVGQKIEEIAKFRSSHRYHLNMCHLFGFVGKCDDDNPAGQPQTDVPTPLPPYPWTLYYNIIPGDFAAIFESGMVAHTLYAAFIGATVACFFLYLSWRHFLPMLTTPRGTAEATTAMDPNGNYPERKPSSRVTIPSKAQGMGEHSASMEAVRLDKEAHATFKPEKQTPRLESAARFDEILRNESGKIMPPIPLSVPSPRSSIGTQISSAELESRASQQQQQQRRVGVKTQSAPSINLLQRPAQAQTPGPLLELHQYRRGLTIPCEDPWGMKLETLLRLFKTPYKVIPDCDPNSSSGPWLACRRQHPCPPPGFEQAVVQIDGDSDRLVEFLYENFPGSRETLAGARVQSKKKVPTHFIKTMVQFHLAPMLQCWRTLEKIDAESQTEVGQQRCVRDSKGQQQQQGHNEKMKIQVQVLDPVEVKLAIQSDLISLSSALDSKLYFIGQSISTIDCTVFGILCQLVWSKPSSELRQIIYQFPNLVHYCHRVRGTLWPDWEVQLKKCSSTSPKQTQTAPNPFHQLFEPSGQNESSRVQHSEAEREPKLQRPSCWRWSQTQANYVHTDRVQGQEEDGSRYWTNRAPFPSPSEFNEFGPAY